MLLCFDSTERKIALFESHKHGTNGGLIVVGHFVNDTGEFVGYLESMFAREWHTGVPVTKIAILKKYT